MHHLVRSQRALGQPTMQAAVEAALQAAAAAPHPAPQQARSNTDSSSLPSIWPQQRATPWLPQPTLPPSNTHQPQQALGKAKQYNQAKAFAQAVAVLEDALRCEAQNVSVWNLLLHTQGRLLADMAAASHVFQRMQQQGVVPSPSTIHILLAIYDRFYHLETAQWCVPPILRGPLLLNASNYQILVYALLRAQQPLLAWQIFKHSKQNNLGISSISIYRIFICALLQSDTHRFLLELCRNMAEDNIKPCLHFYLFLIKYFYKLTSAVAKNQCHAALQTLQHAHAAWLKQTYIPLLCQQRHALAAQVEIFMQLESRRPHGIAACFHSMLLHMLYQQGNFHVARQFFSASNVPHDNSVKLAECHYRCQDHPAALALCAPILQAAEIHSPLYQHAWIVTLACLQATHPSHFFSLNADAPFDYQHPQHGIRLACLRILGHIPMAAAEIATLYHLLKTTPRQAYNAALASDVEQALSFLEQPRPLQSTSAKAYTPLPFISAAAGMPKWGENWADLWPLR